MQHINIPNHLSDLINDLKNIFGENLVSIFGYNKNTRIMVIFKTLQASDLKKAFPAIKKWRKSNKNLPVVMSQSEWKSSADIYPIEYCEIKCDYVILFGENLVENTAVSPKNLRLQCEYEIKNLLVRIREFYLGNSDNPKAVSKMLYSAVEQLISILKSVMLLLNMSGCGDDMEILDKICEQSGFDSQVFKKIIETKELHKTLHPDEIEFLTEKIINNIDFLYNFVDKIDGNQRE